MIDTQIEQATCKITCGDMTGTGLLISSSRVLTARHCVLDAIEKNIQINVRFEVNGVAQDIAATVVADDCELDVCLLLLEREMDISPIILMESLPQEGKPFSSFGFPVVKLLVGHRLEGTISRVLDSLKQGMDLDLQVGNGILSRYEGISGAALISDGKCYGMLRIAIDKSLGAISIMRIAEFLSMNSIQLKDTLDKSANDYAFAPRVEFTQVFDSLISTIACGYAFIEGAHGIGKSTFCETYQPSLSTLEHFGTYSFNTQDGSANSMHLAQPEVFFDWLNTLVSSHLTGKVGRISEKRYSELIVGVQHLLNMLAQEYLSQGKIGVIFVDGLDEAARLSKESLERFVGLLPSTMPTGLVLVISAPSYVNLSAALGSRMTSQSCIKLPELERDASRAFCTRALLPQRASVLTSRIICDRAQGHALYLRYLIDLANGGTNDDQLAALPLINGSIRNYYEVLWAQLLADPEAINLLAIIARLRWGIPTEELADILNEAEQSVLVPTLSRIQHLLLQRDQTTIYHTSFADFLIEKTALREQDVQQRLTDYCSAQPESRYGVLNLVYHGLRSGQEEQARAIANCSQDWVDHCVMFGVKPDVLIGDVDEVLAAAANQGYFVEVIRLLLLGHRIDFRYDTLFTQSADLAVDALVALGKTEEALQHAVRYGRLIIPMHQALNVAFQLINADDFAAAQEILDKAEDVIERQFLSGELTISDFLTNFELRTQILLLQVLAGNEGAWQTLQNFYGNSIEIIRNSVDDENNRHDFLSYIASFFSGSIACLAGRYTPLSLLRKYQSGSTVFLGQILLQLLANYEVFCAHFGVVHDRRLLGAVFSDIQTLFDETVQDWEHVRLDIIDAIITLGAPTKIVLELAEPTCDLAPLQFVDADNINIDMDSFATGMARWRLASLRDKDFPCPITTEIQPSEWRDDVESLCKALAWCDGAARRIKEADDENELHSIWLILEERVFSQLRFTLSQRSNWKNSYALPEAIFPEIYKRLTSFIVEVFPEHLSHILFFIDEQFEVQCGLYSEGFREILMNVLTDLTKLTHKEEVEDQIYMLLKRWRNFIQSNVKNRHELVPELLTIIPLFARLNATEDARLTYQAVLSFSMGPSWYKEDQLSLMTGTLKIVASCEPLETGILSRVASCLEVASGEMTFQRFVRYDKAELLGILCQRANYQKAVRYFMRQSCGTAEQLLAEATEGEIDRTAPLRGMRFPGGAIDEQDALYRMLEVGTQVSDWPICWALLEIYQFGDTRHLQKSAKSYARLAKQTIGVAGVHAVMIERLKLICEGEFDEDQREEFLSTLRNSLPPDLLRSFEEVLGEAPEPTEELSPTVVQDNDTQRYLPERNSVNENGQAESALDSLVMPGMIGTSASSRESEEALARAERQLGRGNTTAARTEALAALEQLQHGGWSIWGNLSAIADRAEAILSLEVKSTDIIMKSYAPLVLAERYTEKWRRAAHLINKISAVTNVDERVRLVRLVVEHIETIIGDTAAKSREYQFLEESIDADSSSILIELILAAVDHPKWLRRDKASELILWLLDKHPRYIPVLGPLAFTMESGNLPDVLCGVLDHLSMKNAFCLWEQLAPAMDMEKIQNNCKHLGRLAVLLRITERAVKKGSKNGEEVRDLVRSAFLQSTSHEEANVAPYAQVQCPTWALICEREWKELIVMGLATKEFGELARGVLQEACAPLSIQTTSELEQILAQGFNDDSEHSLGRWIAKVRYALQVALLSSTPYHLLSRVTQVFRTYNPAQMTHLRILGFTSPSVAWLTALSRMQGNFVPITGNDIYIDFFERVWIEDQYRILRLTMFIHRSNELPVPFTPTAKFLSTQEPTARGTSEREACAKVNWRPTFFSSFTPAVPSDRFMEMTNATGTDLTRAHWRIGRTPPSCGGGPLHEGCFLAIKYDKLRLHEGLSIAWTIEVDGQQLGIISNST